MRFKRSLVVTASMSAISGAGRWQPHLDCPFRGELCRAQKYSDEGKSLEKLLNAGTLANGTDSVQVLAIGAADSAVGTLAPLPTPRFLAALVALPSGDLLAVGGGQHINGAQVWALGPGFRV